MAAPSGGYLVKWERAGLTRDHVAYRIRPIRVDDAARERAFIKALSPDARYIRMMGTMREPTGALVEQFVHVDYARSMAFIALVRAPVNEHIIGIALCGR